MFAPLVLWKQGLGWFSYSCWNFNFHRHHHNGRWEARIGRVFGNKYLYLGTYSMCTSPFLSVPKCSQFTDLHQLFSWHITKSHIFLYQLFTSKLFLSILYLFGIFWRTRWCQLVCWTRWFSQCTDVAAIFPV